MNSAKDSTAAVSICATVRDEVPSEFIHDKNKNELKIPPVNLPAVRTSTNTVSGSVEGLATSPAYYVIGHDNHGRDLANTIGTCAKLLNCQPEELPSLLIPLIDGRIKYLQTFVSHVKPIVKLRAYVKYCDVNKFAAKERSSWIRFTSTLRREIDHLSATRDSITSLRKENKNKNKNEKEDGPVIEAIRKDGPVIKAIRQLSVKKLERRLHMPNDSHHVIDTTRILTTPLERGGRMRTDDLKRILNPSDSPALKSLMSGHLIVFFSDSIGDGAIVPHGLCHHADSADGVDTTPSIDAAAGGKTAASMATQSIAPPPPDCPPPKTWVLPRFTTGSNNFTFGSVEAVKGQPGTRNKTDLRCKTDLPANAHIVACGIPMTSLEEVRQLMETRGTDDLFFLRDHVNHDVRTNESKFCKSLFKGAVALRRSASAAGIDVALHVQQSADPNCRWVGSALVTTRPAKQGEYLTTPFDSQAHGISYWKDIGCRLIGTPLIATDNSDLDTFSLAEIAHMATVMMGALVHASIERLPAAHRPSPQIFEDPIEVAIGFGIVPRACTTVTLAPMLEAHPALKYVTDAMCATYKELPKGGTADLRLFVKNREAEGSDQDLNFKVFEVALRGTSSPTDETRTVQKMCVPLGTAACMHKPEYVGRVLNTLLQALSHLVELPAIDRKPLVTSILTNMTLIRKHGGLRASAHIGVVIGNPEGLQDITRAVDGLDHQSMQANSLIANVNRDVRLLPLTPSDWLKVCDSPDKPECISNLEEGWQMFLAHPVPEAPTSGIKVACWNTNGLAARMTKDSSFSSFVGQVDPDVIICSEGKCAPRDVPHIDEVLKGLAQLGYRFAVWNWCTDTSNGHNGRHHGTIIFSKYRLNDVEFGLSKNPDTQGRVITASVRDATLVCTYVPCSPLNGGPEKSIDRKDFDVQLREHINTLQESRPDSTVIWCGDLNLAPLDTDSSLRLANQHKCPSTTRDERERHAETLKRLNLSSAGLQLQSAPQPHTWHGSVPLYGPKKALSRLSMRIDDVLTDPSHIGLGKDVKTPAVTHLDTVVSKFGSDHKPILWYLSFDGKDISADGHAAWAVNVNGDTDNEQKDITPAIPPATDEVKTDADNEQKDDSPQAPCDDSTQARTTPAVPFASMSRSPAPDIDARTQLKEAIDRIKTLSDRAARIEKEKLQRPFSIIRSLYRDVDMPSYSPYIDGGHKLRRKRDVMPELSLQVENLDGKIRKALCLLDSGAHYNIMSYDTMIRLGLKLQRHAYTGEELELPSLVFGDNRTDTVMGCVDLVVHLTKHVTMKINFFVFMSAPYQLFIGSDFMDSQGGKIDYATGMITVPAGSRTAKLPFKPSKVAKDLLLYVSPRKTITIPARTANVSVPAKWSDIPVRMQGQWGILQDAQCHKVLFQSGLTNTHKARDDSYSCSVMATNPTDEDVVLRPGKPMCTFEPMDPDEYTVLKSEVFDLKATANTTVHASMPSADEGLDLETEWAKYPHIHKIQIAELDEPDADKKAMMDELRWVLIRNQEIWNPAPKEVSKNLEEYIIPLDTEPTPCRSRPFNPNTRAQMSELIEKQLAKKIIEPSSSPFSSPVVLVPKKDGRMRFVVDYRNVNKCVTTDRYTTPRVEIALSVLHGNKYYSAIDLVDAFWSIPLQAKSREVTAFQTPDGLYQYRFLPQGLKTSSAVFCRYMDRMIGNLKWTEVLTYVDDILIFSKSFEEHLSSLNKVCQVMGKFNMTLAPHKCHLFQESVKYLGHLVNREGVKCDPDKVKAIREMSIPQTKDELYSTMCKFRYYRRFVMDYAKIEEPLRTKTLGPTTWTYDSNAKAEYSEKELAAFNMLRGALCLDPILTHPDWNKEFILHTDACKTGLGAVLVQMDGDAERVISYASRSLTKTEVNYNQWELECLAMLWAAKLFRMYLLGTRFKIVTDSNAAKHIMGLHSENAGGRLLRWSLALQDFDFYIEHRKGKRHANADGLSRMPLDSTEPYGEGSTDIEPVGNLDNPAYKAPAAVMCEWRQSLPACGMKAFFPPEDKTAFTTKEFLKLQKDDKYCSGLMSSRDRTKPSWGDAKPMQFFVGTNGLLMRKSRDGTHAQTVVPLSLRAFILNRYHGLPVSGHLGAKRVLKQISAHYYWPHMSDNVTKWIRACLTCARRKRTRNMAASEPGRASNATAPWEKIAIDVVTPHAESTEGYTVILTVICLFTRWVLAIPLKRATAAEVSKALFKHVFCMFGKPKEVVSDNGSEFMNNVVQNMLKKWNVRYHYTGGYQPQACPVERYHRFMNNTMTMLCNKYGSDWAEYLPVACFVYNSSTCESTGYTPYEPVFCARKPTLLHELDLEYQAQRVGLDSAPKDDDTSGTAQAFRQEAFNRLHEMYRDVRKSCEKMHLRNKEATLRKQGEFKNKNRPRYEEGDQVLFWEPQQTQWMDTPEHKDSASAKRPSKWTEKWTGPHTIVSADDKTGINYVIFHSNKCVNVNTHANRLCPFQPWSDGIVSTSWEMDTRKRYRTGEWVQKGALILVPLERPWPFGIGLVLDCDNDGNMDIQWLGNKKCLPNGTFKKGWIRATGNVYYSDTPEVVTDKPYTTKDEKITFNQRDVQMHSFELTPARKISQPMLRAIGYNKKVWWAPKAVLEEIARLKKTKEALSKKRPMDVRIEDVDLGAPKSAKTDSSGPATRARSKEAPAILMLTYVVSD